MGNNQSPESGWLFEGMNPNEKKAVPIPHQPEIKSPLGSGRNEKTDRIKSLESRLKQWCQQCQERMRDCPHGAQDLAELETLKPPQ